MPRTFLRDNKPRPSTRARMEAYLRELSKAERPARAVADGQGVDVLALARWLDQPWFAARVAELRRHLRHRREIDLELGASRAAALLHAAVTAEEPVEPAARAACVEVIRLARDTGWRAKLKKARSAAAAAVEAVEAAVEVAHGDVPAAEAEALMAALEASGSGVRK